MKKITVCILLAALTFSAASAYNPPANGENYLELASPKGLTGASSVTGGAIFSAGPDSVLVNPALTAGEQRVVLNVADTFLWSSEESNQKKNGNALQTSILIPSKLYIFSGYVNLTTVTLDEMYLGNSFNVKAGLSKEITDKLDVGLAMTGGTLWGNTKDWQLSGDLGFVYNMGELAFMKDFRYGASILNMGKGFGLATPFTFKAGCAASLVKTDVVNLGCSLDLTVPGFQNMIFDAGLQFAVKNTLVLSIAEKINLVESINDKPNYIPAIGLAFKFSFDVKNSDYLERNDWSESEMNAAVAYKTMYKTVNAASAGVDLILGMKDTDAPSIDETIFEIEE